MKIPFATRDNAALLFSKDLHYLDHILPLSNLLGIPLLTDSDEIVEIAEKWYPESRVEAKMPLDLLPYLLDKYTNIISCLPQRALISHIPLTYRKKKKLTFFWLPHGYSDKDNLSMCREENFIFSYGPAFEKKIDLEGFRGSYLRMGNLRAHYFDKQKKYYQTLFSEKWPTGRFRLLYAPTWDDYENNSSLDHLESILAALPHTIDLFIKVHPNTILQDPFLWMKRRWQEKRTNIFYIEEIPTIYPLLAQMDLLLTDSSSIAYDMGYFNKPILFLPPNEKEKPMHKLGWVVNSAKEIFTYIDQYQQGIKKIDERMRKKIYQEVFKKNEKDCSYI